MKRRLVGRAPVLVSVAALLLFVDSVSSGEAMRPLVLQIGPGETAGISGFRKAWDTPQPGALVFDAIHRSLLVRFPGVAEKLAAELAKGFTIEKAELLLPFKETEVWDTGYHDRRSFGGDELFKKLQPQWHAVAWPLRRPWAADKALGPTYNAYINGAGYWGKYGAADAAGDRFPEQFGPTEVSYKQTEGRMDVTPLLADPRYGRTLASRLRALEDCGLLVRKWETYDWRFRVAGQGAYEWQVSCGNRGIKINPPQLAVTLVQGHGLKPALQTATDIPALAAKLKRRGGGKPTAVMPSATELAAILTRFSPRQPAWMQDWQWKRVQELLALGGGYRFPSTPEEYGKWIDDMLADPPRYWNGFDAADRLLVWYVHADALPAPVREHLANYWAAWLMPDRPTRDLEHPQAVELQHGGKNAYYERTGDWRGNASYYRDGYCYTISTMNFNHTAAMGALLGGNIIRSDYAIADGRHGLECFPLRLWSWYDGSTQESIDHYYFAITLSDQKMFADFGPTHLDRMIGQSMLAKSVEELTSSYHPGLRRFVASSSRTTIPHILLSQAGVQHIVHTLSRSGALHDLGNKQTLGMPVISHEGPPGRIAHMALNGPWAPEWVANMVDEKPIPYEMTTGYKMWGNYAAHPLWRKTWLGRHYGLASTDLPVGVIQVLGQWRRSEQQAATLQDIGLLMMRYNVNNPFINTMPGMDSEGNVAVVQSKNRLIAVTSPYDMAGKEGVKSLQTTLALFNFQSPPAWEICIDGQRVPGLPAKAKLNQRITIRDGVTYLGIIPLPATDLGRSDEVVLAEGVELPVPPGGGEKIKPALIIESFNLKRDAPLDPKAADWAAIDRAYGGFVVELSDATEHRDFAAFQRHIQDAKLDARWEPEKQTVHVSCASAETIEAGCRTDYKRGRPTPECFTYRRVNGKWPYLPERIDRDSTLTQQGTLGRLEKSGAVLTCEPGRMAYLQTEPISGTYAGFNPLPDPTLWSLATPGGVSVIADGRVSILRLVVRPKENKLWFDYATKAEQTTSDMANALVVFGLAKAPAVERNGRPCEERFRKVELDGRPAYVIPLSDETSSSAIRNAVKRVPAVRKVLSVLGQDPNATRRFVQDWYAIGPFPDPDGKGHEIAYPPEKGVDLKATYKGIERADVAWKRILPPDGAALGPNAVDLLPHFKPNTCVCGYAFTKIASDRDRTVFLYAGSDQRMTVWVNGEKVLARDLYRAAAPDQDRVEIRLRKGENTVLVKLCHRWEGWSFYFRLGDEYGLPQEEGLSYGSPR